MKIIRELNLPFYLTGGTALSRFYFNHRFSDDLDFFVNNDIKFEQYCKIVYDKFLKLQKEYNYEIDKKRIIVRNDFMQIYLVKNDYDLKIDFINDVAPHFGDFHFDNFGNKIDSLRNILSNKITALYRYEPKDVVDVWIISKNYKFDFVEIINEAKQKEISVDVISIYEILNTFPIDKLSLIKWVNKVDYNLFGEEIKIIADDLLNGRENSLMKKS